MTWLVNEWMVDCELSKGQAKIISCIIEKLRLLSSSFS